MVDMLWQALIGSLIVLGIVVVWAVITVTIYAVVKSMRDNTMLRGPRKDGT